MNANREKTLNPIILLLHTQAEIIHMSSNVLSERRQLNEQFLQWDLYPMEWTSDHPCHIVMSTKPRLLEMHCFILATICGRSNPCGLKSSSFQSGGEIPQCVT